MKEAPDKIAIYGAGSMGTVLGAFLSNAGIAIDLISRNKEHIDILKTKGAKIEGTTSFSTPPFDGKDGRGLALLPAEISKSYDIIFLLTKQSDNTETAKMLKNFISPNGVVCTLQNGLPEPALAEILGAEKVFGCICAWGATKTAPGVVELTSNPGNMTFGLGNFYHEPHERIPSECARTIHPMISEIKLLLEKMCPVTIEENFIGARWSKLIINAAFSGLSAITGWDFGKIAANRRSRRYALLIINECIAVCRAANVTIEPIQGRDITRLMDFSTPGFYKPLKRLRASIILPIAMRNHKAIKSGMLRDLDRGRPCEIDNVNGVVSRWGEKFNVPTPVNNRIIEIVHSIERAELKYCPQNLNYGIIK
jgi:2-dehydropantoate 2-reductase